MAAVTVIPSFFFLLYPFLLKGSLSQTIFERVRGVFVEILKIILYERT